MLSSEVPLYVIVQDMLASKFCFVGSVYTETREDLTVDYQNIAYDALNDITIIGIDYMGSCKEYLISFYLQNEIIERRQVSSPDNSLQTATDSTVYLSSNLLAIGEDEQRFFSITARDENGRICSDLESNKTFYRLQSIGMLLAPF